MRVAIVSDIHGNLTAFEAVLADLRQTAPDIVFHGGDLPHGGSYPAEIVDRIRDLNWLGVVGNTDEMLFDPDSLARFASGAPHLETMWNAIAEMAAWTRNALGQERIDWLSAIPHRLEYEGMALVHASPETTWRAFGPEASDEELETAYSPLGKTIAVYGHIHRPFVRRIRKLTIANAGSVGLPYDGDRRASYLMLDDGKAEIRRVEYNVEREIEAVMTCGMPHSNWVGRMLADAAPSVIVITNQ